MDILPGNIHAKPTVKVGFVVKTHGYKGQLVCAFYEEFQSVQEELVEAILQHKFILLEIDGQWVPFEIESFQSDNTMLKLKNIDSVEEASAFAACAILVFENITSDLMQTQHTIVGFSVFDQHGILLGTVVEFVEMPGHDLIEVLVESSQQVVLLPFHDDLLIDFSNDNRSLTIHIADGLLDL